MNGEFLKRRELCSDTARFIYSRAFNCEYPLLFRPLKRWPSQAVCHSTTKCNILPGNIAGFGCKRHPLALPTMIEGSSFAIGNRVLSSEFVAKRHSNRRVRSPSADAGVHSRLQHFATPFELSQRIASDIADLVPVSVKFVDLGAGNGSLSAALICEGYGGCGVEIDARCQTHKLSEGFLTAKWNLLGSMKVDYTIDLRSVVDIRDGGSLSVPHDRLNSFVIANPPFSNLEDFVKCAARLSNLVFILIPNRSGNTLSELAITLGYGIVPINSYNFELGRTRPWHSQDQAEINTTLFMLYNYFEDFCPNGMGLRYNVINWSETNERDYTTGKHKKKCVYIKQNKRNPEQGGFLNYDPSPKGKIFSEIPPGSGLQEIVKVALNLETAWNRPPHVAPGAILPMEFTSKDSINPPNKLGFYNELSDDQLHSMRVLRVFRHKNNEKESYTTYYGLIDRYGNPTVCYKVKTENKPVIVPCAAIKVSKKFDPIQYFRDAGVWIPTDKDEHVYFFNGEQIVPEEMWPGSVQAACERAIHITASYTNPARVEESSGSGSSLYADKHVMNSVCPDDTTFF